ATWKSDWSPRQEHSREAVPKVRNSEVEHYPAVSARTVTSRVRGNRGYFEREGHRFGSHPRLRLSRLGCMVFYDSDHPLEISAVLDKDAGCVDVTHEFGLLPDLDFVQRLDVAVDLAQDDHVTSLDPGAHTPVGPNRQTAVI